MPPSQPLAATSASPNFNSSLSDAWHASWRLRPLPFIAFCVASGGALGFQAGQAWEGSTPSASPPLLAILIIASGFLALSIFQRKRNSFFSRLACGAWFFLFTLSHAAWRMLPAANDVSQLTQTNISRSLPIKAPTISLRGYVADHPARGEFNTQFPLQCVERDDTKQSRIPTRGRVWVSIPPSVSVEVGDAIQVSGELRPLPRATNVGQREERWRFVLAGCWSELRVKKSAGAKHLRAAPHFPLARKIAAVRNAILRHYQTEFEKRSTPLPSATAQLLTAMTLVNATK